MNNEAAQQEMEQIVQAVKMNVQEETELVPEDETLKDEGKQEKKMDIETDKYYAAYYSLTFHMGKVKEVVDQDLFKMKFLHAVSSNKWDWPKRKDTETKDRKFTFCGLIELYKFMGHSLLGKRITKESKICTKN